MAKFLFWNVNSLHSQNDDTRDFGLAVSQIVREHTVDMVLLAECPSNIESIRDQLWAVRPFFSIPCSPRFAIFAGFSSEFITRISPPVPSGRFEVFHLQLPLQTDVLIAVIHGWDR